jgi:hypothetical protein
MNYREFMLSVDLRMVKEYRRFQYVSIVLGTGKNVNEVLFVWRIGVYLNRVRAIAH